MLAFYPKQANFPRDPVAIGRELRGDLDDDDECEFEPGVHEIWDPGQFEDEEAEPEAGDFWIEPEEIEDVVRTAKQPLVGSRLRGIASQGEPS